MSRFIIEVSRYNKIIVFMSSGAAVLEALLNENTNHPKIKETIKIIGQTR